MTSFSGPIFLPNTAISKPRPSSSGPPGTKIGEGSAFRARNVDFAFIQTRLPWFSFQRVDRRAVHAGAGSGATTVNWAGISHLEPSLAVQRDPDWLNGQHRGRPPRGRPPGNWEPTGSSERQCRTATSGNGPLVDDLGAPILLSAWRSDMASIITEFESA